MSFSIKAMCKHGELVHRRKTSEAALKKARSAPRIERHSHQMRLGGSGTWRALESLLRSVTGVLRALDFRVLTASFAHSRRIVFLY